MSTFRTSGTNLRKAKSHNHSVVMEVVRTQGPISRTEISKVTSLSRQTIQNIVAQLLEIDLVHMKASKQVGRGHPGMEVSLNPKAALSLGVQIDRTRMTMVACNLGGQRIWDDTCELSTATPEAANDAISASVEKFHTLYENLFAKVVGCGIAAPGPFWETCRSRSESTSFHEFGTRMNVNELSQRIGLPIVLENDATAGALGESFYGVGQGLESFAYIEFGVGLGLGLVLNGTPYIGANGNAGELGHVIAELDGEPCFCGNSGCLERYLSIDALCRHLGLSPDDSETFEKILELTTANDPSVVAWVESVVPRMHQAVNIVENIADPEAIIIGGTAPEKFLDLLIEKAAPYPPSLSTGRKSGRIRRGMAGRLSIALGASALSMNAHFAPSVSQLVL